MHIIGGAIERVDDPPRFGIAASRGQPLLTQEAMRRKTPVQQVVNGPLGGDVGLGDQIGGPLLAHGEPRGPVFQHRPGGPGRLFRRQAKLTPA